MLEGFDINNAFCVAQELYKTKRYAESMEMCLKLLELDKTNANVWNLAAFSTLELGYFDRAIAYWQEASALQPLQISHHINIAEAYRRNANPTKSIEILLELLQVYPQLDSNATLHFNLARAYSDNKDFINSIKHYTMAIKLDPNDLGAMFNLANAQVNIKHFGEAIELYLNAWARGYAEAGVNLANTYTQIGLFSEALSVYAKLYESYKQDSDFLFNYANALNYANAEFSKIDRFYNDAIALNPQTNYFINYAHFLLKNLHFQKGFEIYEKRKELPNMLPDGINNIWKKGDSLEDKRVLIYYEQGFGDSIMFARFIPQVELIAKSVCILTREPFAELFSRMGIKNYQHIYDINQADIDIAIALPSLPLALNIRHSRDLMCERFLPRISPNNANSESKKVIKIGICFSTDSLFKNAQDKSIPPEILLKAFENISYTQEELDSKNAQSSFTFSQEYYATINKIKSSIAQTNKSDKTICEIHSINKNGIDVKLCKQYGIINHEPNMHNFTDTLRIIEGMDLVISIDTALAHLSASIGKPTIVLLHKLYDWRWGNGISSPWYKSVVCITQSKMGDWSSVIKNLHAYLKGFIAQ